MGCKVGEDGGASFLGKGAVEAKVGDTGFVEGGGDEGEERGELAEDDGFGGGRGVGSGFEVAEEGGNFGGGGAAGALEGDAGGWRGRGCCRWRGGGVEIRRGRRRPVVDYFEDVALVDGFAAGEAAWKFVLGFLVLDILLKALFARAVPAACYCRFDHGLLGANGAFVAYFVLDLLEDVGAEFLGHVLICRFRSETVDELL